MLQPSKNHIAEHVAQCLQLAILLEVSAYPKPGNIHRTADYQGTRYEHFLASAVAVAPCFRWAAGKGIDICEGKLAPFEAKVGSLVRQAVENVGFWQNGGNTLLGSLLLLVPMAVAAGKSLAEKAFSIKELRRNIALVVESTTALDAVNVYEAINMAKPGGLGKTAELDVNDPSSKRKILDRNMTLYDVFKLASSYDSIANEWINNYALTFDLGYPYFAMQLQQTKDINTSTVHTFLKILSEVPDTLIARKAGMDVAKEVSVQAKQVLELGGLATAQGKESLLEFDRRLHTADHKLNPGTTADIITAVLSVALLNGFRP
ncbi:MAG: triphosphoribosyl-dephospho-CoA synthase [Candidatus Bathyarchaeia archaeon]